MPHASVPRRRRPSAKPLKSAEELITRRATIHLTEPDRRRLNVLIQKTGARSEAAVLRSWLLERLDELGIEDPGPEADQDGTPRTQQQRQELLAVS